MEDKIIKKIFPFLLIFFILVGFFTYKNTKLKSPNFSYIPEFKLGDLIFRHGKTMDSFLIAKASDFKYSHVGVILSLNPTKVIHSLPDDYKNKNGVIIENLNDFLENATDFGVARVKFLDKNNTSVFLNNLKLKLGSKFSLNKNGLYCTTFIVNELNKFKKMNLSYTKVNLPLLEKEYLFPKAIWNDENIEIIYEN